VIFCVISSIRASETDIAECIKEIIADVPHMEKLIEDIKAQDPQGDYF